MKRQYTLFCLLSLINFTLFAQDIYVTHRDYSNTNYVFAIQQVNQSTGAILNDHTYTTSITYSYAPYSLTYSSSTLEVAGLTDDDQVIFYHIDNHTERSFTLPSISNNDYDEIVIANGRLFITNKDYSGSPELYYISEIDLTTGVVIGTPHQFTTPFTQSYPPENLHYLASSNEIFGLEFDKVVKYNITTGAESYFNLATATDTDYGDLVIANGRLFVNKRDYSGPSTLHYLIELNPTTGSIIGTPHQYTTPLDSYAPSSLSYLASTNEIVGFVDNLVVKYNITTGSETSFNMPTAASNDYADLVSTDDGTTTPVVNSTYVNSHT